MNLKDKFQKFLTRVWSFLIVAGPGIVVLEADNDWGAVSTYTQSGSLYGTKLFWILLLLLPITYLCQEMTIRLGIGTKRGHAILIYEKFGKWWGRYAFTNLQILNFLTLMTEFIGISLVSSALGISPYYTVIPSALFLITVITSGSYFRWEKIAIFLCLLDFIWIGLLHKTGVPAKQMIHDTFLPSFIHSGSFSTYIFTITAIIGTTVAPWQIYFQQSAICDKGLQFKDVKNARLDTFLSSILTIVVAGCMTAVGSMMLTNHLPYEDATKMAVALVPILGISVKNLLLMMVLNASIMGAMAVSLSSAWCYGEIMSDTFSLNNKIKEAPAFYSVYMGGILAAAALVLIPNIPMQAITIAVQVLAGLMLPPALIFLYLLVNDKKLLAPEYLNGRVRNTIILTIISVLTILALVLIVQPLFT